MFSHSHEIQDNHILKINKTQRKKIKPNSYFHSFQPVNKSCNPIKIKNIHNYTKKMKSQFP